MKIFTSLKIRDITSRNRLVVSPMCQYSSIDGFANDWHLVHLGSRAVGGAGIVFTEATAVTPEGRISPEDLGIWKDEHIEMLSRITKFIHDQGAVAGIQLAHAGRKGSTFRPWDGDGKVPENKGGWIPIGPSTTVFDSNYPVPRELSLNEIQQLKQSFHQAIQRSIKAGFKIIEIHAAHGYLLHEFLSPVSNQRKDQYGGSFENRTRLLLEVVKEARRTWPKELPIFVRISATDWLNEKGWDIDESVKLAHLLKKEGVDLIDCSTGGIAPNIKIPVGPAFQAPFAERIKKETGIMTGAVGMITTRNQAEKILSSGQADVVLMAREFLRNPYWPIHAQKESKIKPSWPPQYERAG